MILDFIGYEIKSLADSELTSAVLKMNVGDIEDPDIGCGEDRVYFSSVRCYPHSQRATAIFRTTENSRLTWWLLFACAGVKLSTEKAIHYVEP